MALVDIFLPLTAGLVLALLFGFGARMLRLPPMLGYLLAGVAVGPFALGFLFDLSLAEALRDIGAVLLLFGLGLRFSFRELVSMWRSTLMAAMLQIALTTVATAGLAVFFGWSWFIALLLGAIVSVAGTVVLQQVLVDQRDVHTLAGQWMLGWTAAGNLVLVAVCLLLPIRHDLPLPELMTQIAVFLGKGVGLSLVAVLLGKWGIVWLLRLVGKSRMAELSSLGVIVLVLAVMLLGVVCLDMHVALAAFFAGVSVGRSRIAVCAATAAIPLWDAFCVLFFLGVGMSFDFFQLWEDPTLLLILLGATLLIKPLVVTITVRLFRRPWKMGVAIGAAFSQLGAISLIVASLANMLYIFNGAVFSAIIGASMVTIAINRLLYLGARKGLIERASKQALPSWDYVRHAILLGHGPVGAMVSQVLMERGWKVTVVEKNLDTVKRLTGEGKTALFGDILRPGMLEEAGIETASLLVLSAEVEEAPALVRRAIVLNPQVRVLVRCRNLWDAEELRHAGASLVAAGEAEVGVALIEAIIAGDRGRGVMTPDYRDEVRMHLYKSGNNP